MRVFLGMTSRPSGATTPFLRVTKSFPETALPKLYFPELHHIKHMPAYDIVPQFMACDGDNFLRGCELLPRDLVPMIELNCGCPTPNAAGKLAGSGILRNPEVFGRSIERLCNALGPGRLAIKMRVGIDNAEEFLTLLGAIKDLPLGRLTVHGRTRRERYSGISRWDLIQTAALAAKAPTWASGDIFSYQAFNALKFVAPAVQGAFIGRGLLYNPWIFAELDANASISISVTALIHALCCYGLLQDLALQSPDKLLARIASGRIGSYCGTSEPLWIEAASGLSFALGMPPSVISRQAPFPNVRLSPTSYRRVRLLWGYMGSHLQGPLASPRLIRAKSMAELAVGIWEAANKDTSAIVPFASFDKEEQRSSFLA